MKALMVYSYVNDKHNLRISDCVVNIQREIPSLNEIRDLELNEGILNRYNVQVINIIPLRD